MTLSDKIVNIPLSDSFSDVLAGRLLEDYRHNPLELADVLILLPNRRACKTLEEAFVRHEGQKPTLLPQMVPVAEVDEEGLMLSSAALEQGWNDLPPAIDPVERLMLFMRIIMAKPSDFGLEKMSLNQACYLAQELGRLIDTVHNQNLSFDNLEKLVPEEYASHWQETLEFLRIITDNWPKILAERGLIDASLRRRLLLEKQTEIWLANPPEKRIIAAGTTATFPAMKGLVKAVSLLPRGLVVLSALDKDTDDDGWDKVDESHPQFELKELLSFLEIDRHDVPDWTAAANPAREKLISEVMRPAATTDKWRNLEQAGIEEAAFAGMKVLNCADVREEALSIALLMREVLETPEKTAALVTPDRNLARRVAAELERWNVKVDDSAGRPLGLTPVGMFLRLAARAVLADASRVEVLSLLKHPLTSLGTSGSEVRKRARRLEKNVWRGAMKDGDAEAETILDDLNEALGGLREVCCGQKASLAVLLAEHIHAAERLAATAEKGGQQILWRGEDGEAAANFIADWYEQTAVLGEIDVSEYPGLFEAMMAGTTVRPRYGTHPRLKILGPMEARLSHFDRIIIGEVNEGIWPQSSAADPWMSRPMKKDFGFPLPEKAVGVLGLDFCSLAGASEVYLTRAERVEGTPMVKSRWLMRLETVAEALLMKTLLKEETYSRAAEKFDEPERPIVIKAPEPRPEVRYRPRELSASGIELLMRDPYSVFARYILKLKPLDEVEQDLTMADYGTIIHGILEEFNNQYSTGWPDKARELLLAAGRDRFEENRLAAERQAFWWPAFEKIVDWLVETERRYRPEIRKVHNEQTGNFEFEAPAGTFRVTAKADRVDETHDGRINIIDYKTGKARTPKEVSRGFAPQLPIEGLIASKGGFAGLPAASVNALIYWQLAKKETVINDNIDKLLADTEQRIKDLINLFDFKSTAYISHPNPQQIPEYSDYEHLARVKEWSVTGESRSADD